VSDEEAKAWLEAQLNVSRETLVRLESLVTLVTAESQQQNLIAASTLPTIWDRHIVDSAQLLALAPAGAGSWLDLGSGAGFPGMVVAAIARSMEMVLVESRRKRIDFLTHVAAALGVSDRVTIAGSRLELIETRPFDVISARAFAPLDRLLPLAVRFSTPKTVWLLPKGRGAASELAAARSSWQGEFRIVASVTDPDAAIIVARNVQPKGRR
jgi:16S rRNA (guanine527-N7)-methyltransferase